MKKIIVISMTTLDGVMQAPGGPEEDTSGGFEYGGWTAPYSFEEFSKEMEKEMQPADYLLGRKTFEIWAAYWPYHGEFWPSINSGKKYVVSRSLEKSDPLVTGWENSVLLKNVEEIKQVKSATNSEHEDRDIHVWGSSNLIQTLFENDLVDELRLKIFPLTLGKGKKLFENGTIPAAFKLTDSSTTPNGIIIANYKRNGEVKTGSVAV